MERDESEYMGKNRYDAIFIFPGYTFPQKTISPINREGFVERIAGRELSRRTRITELLFDSRLKDIAAILMVKASDSDTLVPMSRITRSWIPETNAQLLENHIRSIINPENNAVNIIREEKSYDTQTEVNQVRELSKQREWKNVAIMVTDESTAKRVRHLIERFEGDFPSCDIKDINSILLNETYGNPTLRKYLKDLMNKYNSSNFAKFWKIRESIIGTIEQITPNLLSKIADRTRRVN